MQKRTIILVWVIIDSKLLNVRSLIRKYWWEKTLKSINVWRTFIRHLRVFEKKTCRISKKLQSPYLPKRPVEHLLLPEKQFSMLAPNPPSEPSKFSPPCLIFVGKTSNILLFLTAILGMQEIWPVSGSIWKSSSGFTHGPKMKDIHTIQWFCHGLNSFFYAYKGSPRYEIVGSKDHKIL